MEEKPQVTPVVPPVLEPTPQKKPLKFKEKIVPNPTRSKVEIKTIKGKEIIVTSSLLDLFLDEYVKNGGNGTKAALKVFKVTSKRNAAIMAHKYLKKAQVANRLLLEKKGYSAGPLLEIAIQNMRMSKSPEWWDRIVKISGAFKELEEKVTKQTTTNIISIQKKLLDDYTEGYVEGEVLEEENE